MSYFDNIRARAIGSALIAPRVRAWLLRRLGASVGSARVREACSFYGDLRRLSIGDDAFINAGAVVFASGGVTVGNGVAVGPECMLITGTHDIGEADRRASRATTYAPIIIGDGAWLGARVLVHPGVEIGSGSIIAAGAVVVSDIPSNVMAVGVPAKVVRELHDPAPQS